MMLRPSCASLTGGTVRFLFQIVARQLRALQINKHQQIRAVCAAAQRPPQKTRGVCEVADTNFGYLRSNDIYG
jgi:hypothetical protein